MSEQFGVDRTAMLSHRQNDERRRHNQTIDLVNDLTTSSPNLASPTSNAIMTSDDGRDKFVSQRRRLFGNIAIDKGALLHTNKNKYNQHQLPEYQAMLKYNIITGQEEEDRLPVIPSARRGNDATEGLVFKQREVDQILKKMRQQRELVNGTFVR